MTAVVTGKAGEERPPAASTPAAHSTAAAAVERVGALAWDRVSNELDAHGCAVLGRLLAPETCAALAALYPDDGHFRSRVVMGRHGFGRGEYKYFSYPLPETLDGLRTALYARLSPVANRWNEALRRRGVSAAGGLSGPDRPACKVGTPKARARTLSGGSRLRYHPISSLEAVPPASAPAVSPYGTMAST